MNSGYCSRNLMSIRVGGALRTLRPRSEIRKCPRQGDVRRPACSTYTFAQATRFAKRDCRPLGKRSSCSLSVNPNSEASPGVGKGMLFVISRNTRQREHQRLKVRYRHTFLLSVLEASLDRSHGFPGPDLRVALRAIPKVVAHWVSLVTRRPARRRSLEQNASAASRPNLVSFSI